MKPNIIISIYIFLFFVFSGCASGPDIVNTDKQTPTGYSNAEIREVTIDNPTLLSGDFFRTRQQPTTPRADARDMLAKEQTLSSDPETADQKKLEDKVNALQKEVALLKTPPPETTARVSEKTLQVNNSPLERRELKLKTGLLIDNTRVLPANVLKISRAVEKFAASQGIVLVGNDEIHETLAQNNALENKDLYRTAGILTVYPGIRMLVLVEDFRMPDFFPGTGSAVVSIVDSGLLYRYKPVRFEMPIQTDKEGSVFLESIMASSFNRAIELSKVTPWFCRVFSSEETLLYINAGKETGLEQGMFLKVASPGKRINAPAGTPAGWIPGQTKGKLKVERFFGKDFAVCSIVEGEKPTVYDYLLE